jgi:hypothetical protein
VCVCVCVCVSVCLSVCVSRIIDAPDWIWYYKYIILGLKETDKWCIAHLFGYGLGYELLRFATMRTGALSL